MLIEKAKGEILGVVIVESGWGSILPTVIIANMMHAGPAERSGRLNIGDQIMSINGTSLVGLPLSTCQSIIKVSSRQAGKPDRNLGPGLSLAFAPLVQGLKNQSRIKLNIVRCPPVTTVLIRRPDLRYQLGFSVQNGIVSGRLRPRGRRRGCSLTACAPSTDLQPDAWGHRRAGRRPGGPPHHRDQQPECGGHAP